MQGGSKHQSGRDALSEPSKEKRLVQIAAFDQALESGVNVLGRIRNSRSSIWDIWCNLLGNRNMCLDS